jgi:hypothetical protein
MTTIDCLQDSSYLSLPNYLYGVSLLRIGSCIVEQLPGSLQMKRTGDSGKYVHSFFSPSIRAPAKRDVDSIFVEPIY